MPIKLPLADQPDFFIPYLADLPLRDQREMMERPFFSLSKRKRMKPIHYSSPNGNIFVDVSPHPDHGMATIWDADILIYASSVLNYYKNQGKNFIPRTLEFQPYDILRSIGREPGGMQYTQLQLALGRLQSTVIRTNIRVEGKKKTRQFSYIDAWDEKFNSNKQSMGIEMTLSDWFYEGILMDGGVLAIDPEYFEIKGGRERWLYKISRKHTGTKNKDFKINFPTLYEKSGSESNYRRFKFEIIKIVDRNELPRFELSLIQGDGEPQLCIKKRDDIKLPSQKSQNQISAIPMRQLTISTVNIFKKHYPDANLDELKSEYDKSLENTSTHPDNYQMAFLQFAEQKLKPPFHHTSGKFEFSGTVS